MAIFKIKYIYVGFFSLKKVWFICFNEIPWKMMKNAFYFILKSLFVLKKCIFCPDFGYVGKWFDEKAKVNFKVCNVAK